MSKEVSVSDKFVVCWYGPKQELTLDWDDRTVFDDEKAALKFSPDVNGPTFLRPGPATVFDTEQEEPRVASAGNFKSTEWCIVKFFARGHGQIMHVWQDGQWCNKDKVLSQVTHSLRERSMDRAADFVRSVVSRGKRIGIGSQRVEMCGFDSLPPFLQEALRASGLREATEDEPEENDKQEQAERAADELERMLSSGTHKTMCKLHWVFFEEYVSLGFTREEALTLVVKFLNRNLLGK